MFKKILLIIIALLLLFLSEFLFYNIFNGVFAPDLLLLAIIFFTLVYGIRYGIFTAVLAGIFKDSFNVGFFGFHILGFVVCAYMTISLRKVVYYSHSWFVRKMFVLIIFSINFLIHAIAHVMFDQLQILHAIKHIYIPGAISTVLISSILFKQLRKCALKFFV